MKHYMSVSGRRGWLRIDLLAWVGLGLLFCVPSLASAAPLAEHAFRFNSVPRAVAMGQAQRIKPMVAKRRLKLAISLPLRNQAELNELLKQIYNPVSPLYHQYLDVDEFTRRFGPTQADYDAVVAWANANGLKVTHTSRNRHLIQVTATAADVDRALHVQMNVYQHPTQNRTFYAPDRAPRVDLTVPVLNITGLDDYVRPQPRLKQGTPAQRLAAAARAGGSGVGGQFLPSDMRAAYYGSGPLTGAGQTVAIFSFNGYLTSDLQLYFSTIGMPQTVPVNNVLVGTDGACVDISTGAPPCSDGESILDIANVMGMAPGLTQVLFYEGLSGPAILNRIATDNIAKVISSSWGSSDLGPANDPIFLEFKAQGQTFVSATGDDGAYDANAWLPPSLNPLILQVGGTVLTTNGAGGAWVSESAWPDSGGGFYAPAGYATPDYQKLTGVINGLNAGSPTWRNDPDVAAEGDYDNPTVSNGTFLRGFGGTSFAAPRWAGFIALANQQSLANGGSSLGFVNASLYGIGVGGSYASAFHDVSSGDNGHGGNPGFAAVAGYDLVTGWGSPQGVGLISTLSGSTTAPGFVLAASPPWVNVARGSSVQTAISVHGINGFSSAVNLSVSGLPSGVMAGFAPTSTASNSTLTLDAAADATLGASTITVAGMSGALSRSMPVHVFVGNAAQISTQASLTFNDVVPLGLRSNTLTVTDAANSIPLDYAASAHSSSGGSCSGAVPWLAVAPAGGTLRGGESAALAVIASPAAAMLAPGDYSAEVCLTSNDPSQPLVALPVSMHVIPGPASDNIFHTGFEPGETDNTGGVVSFTINMPVEDTQAGSALDLATGNYHTWSADIVDNINLYSDSTHGNVLGVYWYEDQLIRRFKNKVGGAVDANDQYEVLHSGDVVGSAATFSNSVSGMPNWVGGADGYLGIAFLNSQTNEINYGYIHVTTSASKGFPAKVLEYGFDSTGAAVTIP